MNVLAISCHPDDMEIQCAGTLLKCLKRGGLVRTDSADRRLDVPLAQKNLPDRSGRFPSF